MRILYEITDPAFAAAGITVIQNGNVVTLDLGGADPRSNLVSAVIEEGKIAFFPHRSSHHRRILAQMGNPIELPSA